MTLTLDRLPPELSGRILCWYMNLTGQVQVARITNIPNWYFEQTVFPGERFLFEAVPEAELEIYECTDFGEISCEKLRCDRLQVSEGGSSVASH
ncbi:MAG: DUF1830 domain-containing protein [Actinomycetota bacterium]